MGKRDDRAARQALGLASGLCLSLILTGVINRAFFGWTIQLAFPWWSLAWTPSGSSQRRSWQDGFRHGGRVEWLSRRRFGANEGIAGFKIRMADWTAVLAIACVAADWQMAKPGWRYDFPRDHHAHDAFKTEWWYFTGNVTNNRGQRFGYELTFFRQGIRSPIERAADTSRFIVDDLKFAHFAVTDAAERGFYLNKR